MRCIRQGCPLALKLLHCTIISEEAQMWRRLVAWMRFGELKSGAKPLSPHPRPQADSRCLAEAPFSPNPGDLRMFLYLPQSLTPGAPLVVVLHGCGQTANGYGTAAGWCELGRQLGFAVLAPEQKPANNPNTCFNWFNPEDVT